MIDVENASPAGARVRVAVVGVGDVSAVHFRAIAALEQTWEAELVGVCDVDLVRASEAGRALGAPAYGDARAMLEALRPDVVHVCTPHDQHVGVALECLRAGSNVLLEKPLAHELDDAQRIVDAAAEHPELRVGVCLQNRYNPAVQIARTLIDSGELGEVHGAAASVVWRRTAEYFQAKAWRGERSRSGGGVLINQAIHTVDLIQWLVGDVDHIAGYSSRSVPYPGLGKDIEDTAHLLLHHREGASSVLFATLAGVANFPVTLEITTTRATLTIRDSLSITWGDGRRETFEGPNNAPTGRPYWGNSHLKLIADFYRTLGDSRPFWIGPAEGMASLRIVKSVA